MENLKDQNELKQMQEWEQRLNDNVVYLVTKAMKVKGEAKGEYQDLIKLISELSAFTNQLINQNILLKKNCAGLMKDISTLKNELHNE